MTTFDERMAMIKAWHREHSPEERAEGSKDWARRQASRRAKDKARCTLSLGAVMRAAGIHV